jgi:hypothetical protein
VISNSYATGSTTGTYYVGGLAGRNYYQSTIENSYSTCSVSGTYQVGGFIGYNYYNNQITNSYWDTETSGTTIGVGSGPSTGVIGKTTAEMKKQATFINWDFTNIWDIIENKLYPYLVWQYLAPVADIGGPYTAGEGTEITFDASDSFDTNNDALQYRYDYDNDGTWDTVWSSNPLAYYTWYDDYTGEVKVEVYDGIFYDTDTTTVIVSNEDPKAVISGTISVGDEYIFVTNYRGESYFIDIETDGSLTTPQLVDDIDYGTYGAGLGDFDNDGDLDALVGDRYNTWYHEKLGDGNNFASPVLVDSTSYSYSGDFAEADYDNDGNLDAIKANVYRNYFTLYSGNGDGTFAISTITSPRYIRGMDSGDFNNDGKTDFVAVSYGSYGKGYIYLGNGDGTFQSTTEFTIPRYGSFGVSAGDFDNDGDDDVVAGYYPTVQYLPGNGDGTFGTAVDLGFRAMAIGDTDINNDGYLDLVYSFGSSVYIRRGNGDGTFSTTTSSVSPSSGIYGVASSSEIIVIDEGEDAPFTGKFTDPGYLDTHTATWNWGDGSPTENGLLTEENDYPDATGEVTGSHKYADNGYFTITLTVSDDDGEHSTDTGKVKVLNVAPTAAIDKVEAPVPNFILPGDTIKFTGSVIDPGTADTHNIDWDFDDGTTLNDVSLVETHSYSIVGEYNVTLTVTDDDGASDSVIVTIKVVTTEEATEDLITDIEVMNLPDGTENSFTSKLANALKSIENDRPSAKGQLEAFINEVEAQRGKELTIAEADALIAAAKLILANI